MKVMIGPMTVNRTTIITKAFDKLDMNMQGLIDVSFIILYSCIGVISIRKV